MDPDLFLADLQEKPDALDRLARVIADEDPWAPLAHRAPSELLLVGMGSSHSAGAVAAARLRARGVRASAELASSDLLPPVGPAGAVVAVSATGRSRETLDAVERLAGAGVLVALTADPASPLAERADVVLDLGAREERGGVACRSYQHTLALLLALEARLTGSGADVAATVRTAAVASADLLEREEQWRPEASALLLGPRGTHVVAPARRLCSAQQSALMLREGPRVPATGCETGDWSHVDVYLTKTTDYRMLLLTGSRWEDELLRWTAERGTSVVAVGPGVPGAHLVVRHPGDEDDDVRLLTEVLVAELVAARAWQARAQVDPAATA